LHLKHRAPRRIGRHRPLAIHHLIDLLRVGEVRGNLSRAHAESPHRLQAGDESAVVDLLGMQLQVNPLIHAHCHYLLYIPRARTEGEAIERVQGAPLITGAGGRLILLFFSGQQLRHGTRQAEAHQENGGPSTNGLGAAHAHEDTPGKTTNILPLSTRTGRNSCCSWLPKTLEV
jgi:hypothetical protein